MEEKQKTLNKLEDQEIKAKLGIEVQLGIDTTEGISINLNALDNFDNETLVKIAAECRTILEKPENKEKFKYWQAERYLQIANICCNTVFNRTFGNSSPIPPEQMDLNSSINKIWGDVRAKFGDNERASECYGEAAEMSYLAYASRITTYEGSTAPGSSSYVQDPNITIMNDDLIFLSQIRSENPELHKLTLESMKLKSDFGQKPSKLMNWGLENGISIFKMAELLVFRGLKHFSQSLSPNKYFLDFVDECLSYLCNLDVLKAEDKSHLIDFIMGEKSRLNGRKFHNVRDFENGSSCYLEAIELHNKASLALQELLSKKKTLESGEITHGRFGRGEIGKTAEGIAKAATPGRETSLSGR